MKRRQTINRHRSRFGGAVAVFSAVVAVVLVSVSCQTSKKGGEQELVGNKVQLTELRQVIQTQVADPARSNAMMQLAGNAEQTLGNINENFIKRSKEFGKMSADHSKTAGELQNYMRTWDAEDHNQRAQLANVMLAMRSQSTPAEWPAVSNAFVNSIMRQSDRYQTLQTMEY